MEIQLIADRGMEITCVQIVLPRVVEQNRNSIVEIVSVGLPTAENYNSIASNIVADGSISSRHRSNIGLVG